MTELAAQNPPDWNQAYDRLETFLRTFELRDHAYVSRLALEIFEDAKKKFAADPSRDPTAVTLDVAQARLTDWIATNLDQDNKARSHVLPAGYVALLLSRVNQTSPQAFLASPLPEDLRQSMRRTLLETGPDLNVSSMTPRHLDYGPMLAFAQQTWHRWDAREFIVALVFWASVYAVFYWWLSQLL
jgi:hypothetical protein